MYVELLKQEKRFGLRFLGLNNKEKGATNVLSSYKLRNKLSLVYLEVILQENRCGYYI